MGEMGESGQKMQTSSYKVNHLGTNQHKDHLKLQAAFKKFRALSSTKNLTRENKLKDRHRYLMILTILINNNK